MAGKATSPPAPPLAALLVDYAAGEMSPEEAIEFERVLQSSETYRRLVEDLRATAAFQEVGSAAAGRSNSQVDEPSDGEIDEALRHTLAVVDRGEIGRLPESLAAEAVAGREERISPRGRLLRGPWALLASAAILLMALGWGMAERSGRLAAVAEQAQPQANARLISLHTVADPLRSLNGSGVSLNDGLAISLEGDLPFPGAAYLVELRLADDDPEVPPLRSVRALEPTAEGTLTFYLPPDSLPPGIYRLTVLEVDGAVWPRRYELALVP
ncbi:MAG: hypothetical protein AAGN46_04985 [Acidobacteriota bacterium]